MSRESIESSYACAPRKPPAIGKGPGPDEGLRQYREIAALAALCAHPSSGPPPQGATAMMNGIVACRDLVIAVGDGGIVETHGMDRTPTRQRLASRPNLHAVSVHSSAFAVVVGEAGGWWSWNGRAWRPGAVFTDADLCSVVLIAPGDLAVGDVAGRVWRLNGERAVSVAEAGASAVSSLWSDRGVLWGCSGRTVFRVVGQRHAGLWQLPDHVHAHAVCGASDEDGSMYAVGRGGAWRFTGSAGSAMQLVGGDPCYSATCSADGARLYVVSGNDLREWTESDGWRILFRAPTRLLAVALDEDRALVWAAGEGGVYRHLLTLDEPSDQPRARR